MYLSEIEGELMKVNEHNMNYYNFSKEERDALHKLSRVDSIIIKPADKGSGIVVLDRVNYLVECQKYLSKEEVYEKIGHSP